MIVGGACPALAAAEAPPIVEASIAGMPRHAHGGHGVCDVNECCDVGIARLTRPDTTLAVPARVDALPVPTLRAAPRSLRLHGGPAPPGPPGAATPLLS